MIIMEHAWGKLGEGKKKKSADEFERVCVPVRMKQGATGVCCVCGWV